MPRDLIYLSMAESGFKNAARSWAKAVGPWQFMPYTGKNYGLEVGFYLDERRDPLKATIAASKYLKQLSTTVVIASQSDINAIHRDVKITTPLISEATPLI